MQYYVEKEQLIKVTVDLKAPLFYRRNFDKSTTITVKGNEYNLSSKIKIEWSV